MAFARYQFRRDTAANWTSANPVLFAGELGLETDTSKFKIGNGTAGWNALPYGGIKGDTGATGAAGTNGTNGNNGWSPILANQADGERRVLRLVDWTGGTGTKPAVPTDNYIGPTGFTNLAGATDIRGATGATGAQGATGATGPAGATQNTFGTIAVAGQNNVVADAANDTLTLIAGTNITLTTNDVADSVTIAATIAAQNTFTAVSVGTTPTPTVLQADTAADTLSINAGAGISLTADAATDTLSIVNAGVTSNVAGTGISVSAATGASTITNTGVTSLTTSSGLSANTNATGAVSITNTGVTSVAAGAGIGVSAATGGVTISNTGVTSVNGSTGAVSTIGADATTNTARSAAITTTVTTVGTRAVAGAAAGNKWRFEAVGLVTNTAAASNLVVTVAVGATAVATLTQALGTTARTSQPVEITGYIHLTAATTAEGYVRAFMSSATAFDTAAAPAAAVTVAATDVNLKVNTSVATSTFTLTSFSIEQVK